MFIGSFVALVTPIKDDLSVDYETLEKLVSWHIDSGTDGLVILGTTGEYFSLSSNERWDIVHAVTEQVDGRIPVIVNTGVASTQFSCENTRVAKELGADGALVVTPYYVKPSQEGLIKHYRAISEVGLPLIVYHNPGRAGCEISLETLREIDQFESVVAIKEASGCLEYGQRAIAQCKAVLHSGDDGATMSLLEQGAQGSISVIGNLIPRLWGEMVRSKDRAIFERVYPLIEALSLSTNPQGIKYAMSQLRLCRSRLRLPLMEPDRRACEAIMSAMDKTLPEYSSTHQL